MIVMPPPSLPPLGKGPHTQESLDKRLKILDEMKALDDAFIACFFEVMIGAPLIAAAMTLAVVLLAWLLP